MNKRCGFLLTFFLIVFPVWLYSQAGFSAMKDPADFRQRLAAAAAGIKTLESSFTQEKNMSMLTEKIISRGKFYFRKEKSLRWEYSEPYKYLIILHDDKIIISDEGKVKKFDVQSNKVFREINTIILGCVQGTLLQDQKQFASLYFENQANYLVKLKPLGKPMKETLGEIRIWFDKSDFTVSRLELQEISGDYTNITFTSKKINVTIPDDKFKIN